MRTTPCRTPCRTRCSARGRAWPGSRAAARCAGGSTRSSPRPRCGSGRGGRSASSLSTSRQRSVRDVSGYRRYDAQAVVDLIRIKTLAEAGAPLARVKELIHAPPEQFAVSIEQTDRHLEQRIRELHTHRRRIARLAAHRRVTRRRKWGSDGAPSRPAHVRRCAMAALLPAGDLLRGTRLAAGRRAASAWLASTVTVRIPSGTDGRAGRRSSPGEASVFGMRRAGA